MRAETKQEVVNGWKDYGRGCSLYSCIPLFPLSVDIQSKLHLKKKTLLGLRDTEDRHTTIPRNVSKYPKTQPNIP